MYCGPVQSVPRPLHPDAVRVMREVCPEFPGHPQLIHWSIADPSGEGYPAFRRVAGELRTRIGFLLARIARLGRGE